MSSASASDTSGVDTSGAEAMYDVIVVGGGGSGLAAATSAAENGASALLLERESELGGTTGIAVGSFTTNRTRLQQAAGVTDSLADHAQDAGQFAPAEIEARNNDELRQYFLSHSAETLEWLEEMGLRFHGPSPEPPNRVPRMHNVIPGARAYIGALQDRLQTCGGRVVCDADVVQILRDKQGVTGVVALIDGHEQNLLARRGVVMAAGDYTNSADLISRFKGERFSGVEGINPRSTGHGHTLCEQAGAQLLNMDITYGPELRFVAPEGRGSLQKMIPSRGPLASLVGKLVPLVPDRLMARFVRRLLVTWQHPEDALLEDGAILLNEDGERFCDERLSPEREIAIAAQPGKRCFLLLDEALISRYSAWPHFISTAPRIAYAYVDDYLRLRPDVAVAGRLEEVTDRRGLPSAAVRAVIDAVNVERGDVGVLPHLAGKRWALLGPAKAYFTTTEGGVAIDQEFRALDVAGDPIRGLYAIGQNGLGGQILWGHGLHIAWAMTSGRLVGRQLAQDACA
ncbi:MAG: FAD-dependent oxidoreductase [Gemmatimonadetes bacterium]|nr:FAD-dependent oxidoreductase [Gemmatimonadota bacterium]